MRTFFTKKGTKKQFVGHCILPYCPFLCLPLLCCLLLCSQLSTAQSYPVQVLAQSTPPTPAHFSDFANTNTLNGPLRVQIVLNDLQISNRQVRLQVSFSGNGIGFKGRETVVGAAPLFLEGGLPIVLDHTLLAPYFEFANLAGISPNAYGAPIPDGAYQVCFEVFDVLTGKRLSNNACTILNVFKNSPPLLVLPQNGSDLVERSPQNIVFQWTPRHINVGQVEYELSLVEIWDNALDPQAAFLGSNPLFTATTSATTYVYGPSDPMLLPNRTYAWRVRAKAKQGAEDIGMFENQGHSQIFSFKHIEGCHVPHGIRHEIKGAHQANVLWDDPSTEVPRFTVRYRAKGDGNQWFLNRTTANWTTLWDLKAGTTYEYQLKKACTVAESDWSPIRQFTTHLQTEEEDLYQCGMSPSVDIANQDPLPDLGVGESFTAGDFQVVATEVSGGNGYFTGTGYVRLPYLSNIKVAVSFTNILVNTDRQLAQGTVITEFDPTMGNIVDTGDVVETVGELVGAVGELGEAIGDVWDEIFKKKEELLAELAEAESLEEQQVVITKINTYETVTVGQQIDQMPNKENLPRELQQELDTLKMEGSLATTEMLSPKEIADISTADAKRRERIREIAAIAGEEFVIFGDKMVHHIMAIVNGYWCAKNEGVSNFEYFYGQGWSFFDFKGNLDGLGLKDLVVKFKTKNENHGKKLVATEYVQGTTKVFEGRELEYEGFSLTFNTTDRITKGSNSLQLCFKSADDRSTFVNTFLVSPPTGNALYYTNLTRDLHTKMASKKYDDAHLLLTMLPKCEIEAFTTAQRVPLINSLVDETTTDGLQEQLIIRLLEEYEDVHILEQADLYRQLDLVRLFKSVDGAESDLLTFALGTMVERYRSVVKLPYGGTVAIQEISTGNIFTRYHIARDSVGAFQLALDTNAAGYNTSYHNSEVVVPYTDIFSIFTVEGESLEIPYLLLLKGVVKKEEERNFRQMMVAVDVASLAFGAGELKLAFTATSNLARAFRIALGSADIMATAADVACNGEDNELCQDWQKVSGWVQLGLISATGADLLYQTLKRSTKLQDEVLRLGLTNAVDDIPLVKIVDNYTPSLTGKIAEFMNVDGSLFGRLYRQTTSSGKIEYTFKWTKPDGNIVNITGLSAEIENGFIEIDLLLDQVQGKGVGKVIFDDVFKHYDGVGTNYQGFKGRWEGKNPNYSNGSSDNLIKYWEARKTMTKSEAAFETWTGKRALENGFVNANVTEINNDLVIVEFTR